MCSIVQVLYCIVLKYCDGIIIVILTVYHLTFTLWFVIHIKYVLYMVLSLEQLTES